MGYAKDDNSMIEEHILKDMILAHLINTDKKGCSVGHISDMLSIDYYYILYCVDDLINQKLVNHFSITNEKGLPDDKIISVNHRGRFFLNQSGGYSQSHKIFTINKRYTQAKTIMTILNAIAILIIGIWSINVADKSNKLDNAVLEIEILKNHVDSLRTVILNYQNADKTDTTTSQKRIP